MTREIIHPQMDLGQTAIADITFRHKSRDDIPKILKGLQYIYVTETIRKPVFKLLETKILPDVNKQNGRPGLSLWKILVMGVLRLDLNCDYDRVEELVNQHRTVRQMLGHSDILDPYEYHFQTIKDNVCLLTPKLLEEMNVIIVKAGHELLGKKKESEVLRGRCDSFVVETDVHFPTDISLLYDAVRKVIQLTAGLSFDHGIDGWRQFAYNVKQVKKQTRVAQQKKKASGRTEEQKAKCNEAMKQAHRELIDLSQGFVNKSLETLEKIAISGNKLSLSDTCVLL